MVNSIENLLRREADIDGMQNSSYHGNSIEALQIPVTIPIHDGYSIPGPDTDGRKGASQSAYPFLKFSVGKAAQVAIHYFLFRIIHHRGLQQIFDYQRVGVG